MQPQKELITETALLEMANKIIKEHEDFIHGMRADSVEQKGDILVFKGEYFLAEDGTRPARPWRSSTCSSCWPSSSPASTSWPDRTSSLPTGCRPQAASVFVRFCPSTTTQLRPAILA